MPLPQNSQILTNALEALPLLDGRFSNMKLVNIDSVSDQRRGCFSLVFHAIDAESGRSVALKFFDPESLNNVYRRDAFRRESVILQTLVGADRCLQAASPLSTYDFPLPTPTGPFLVPCDYFAIEWLDDDVDRYFFNQDEISAFEKLEVFDEIVKGVAVLHSKGVFHRDLKPDNLRVKIENGHRYVVPIDLGTAARVDSQPIQSPYSFPVGHGAYASPEAHCGLAGNRLLAKYTDLFALGCMLFELFNKDLHVQSLLRANPNFQMMLMAMKSRLNASGDDRQQLNDWKRVIDQLGKMYATSNINGPGSSVPPGIAPILNEVMASLTEIDYRRRPTVSWVRHRIEVASKVLRNEKEYQRRLAASRERRKNRLERLAKREMRIAQTRAKRQEVL